MSIMINECVQQRQQPPQQTNLHHHQHHRHQEHAQTLIGQNGIHSAVNQLNHHPILSGPLQTSMIIDQSASQGQHYSHYQTVPDSSSPVAPLPASLANSTPQHSFVVNQTVMVPSVVVNYHNHSHLHQTSIATNNDYHSQPHPQHQNQHPFHQHQHYSQQQQPQSHNEHHLQPQTHQHEQHPLNGYNYTMYHQQNVQINETNYLYHSNVNYETGKQVNNTGATEQAGYNDGRSLMTNGYHHQAPGHHQNQHHQHSNLHHHQQQQHQPQQRHHQHALSHHQHPNIHHQQQSLNIHSQSHHQPIQQHQHHQSIHHQSTHSSLSTSLPVNSQAHLSTGTHGQQQSALHPLQHHQHQHHSHQNHHHHQGNEISDYHDVSKIFNVINDNDS